MTTLRVGLAETNITPWLGIELSGYGFFLERTGESVHEELVAQAVALECGGQSALILSADLIGYEHQYVMQLRQEIAAATGIDPDAIAFTATHTHSGPATIFLHGCGTVDDEYMRFLSRRLVDLARHACHRLEPARLFTAQMPLPGVAFNRTRADGPVDDRLQCLFVEDESGALKAVLTRFSCHPVVFRHSDRYISPDFVGAFRRAIRRQWPGVMPVYLQGACGDLNPDVKAFYGDLEQVVAGVGLAVAGGVMTLYGRRRPHPVTGLAAAVTTIELPHSRLTEELVRAFVSSHTPPEPHTDVYTRGRARFAREAAAFMTARLESGSLPAVDLVELQAIRLGGLTMLFHGAELFSAPAIALRERFDGLWVVGYANDFWGYVPDRVDFERKGYAAVTVPYMVHKPPYVPDVADHFVAQAAGFLAGLNARQEKPLRTE